MWLDELYDWTVLAVARFAARLSDFLDRYFWDGIVSLVGGIGGLFGRLTRSFDEGAINSGVDDATTAARGFGQLLSRAQSGQVQILSRRDRDRDGRASFFFTHGASDRRPDLSSGAGRALRQRCAQELRPRPSRSGARY